MFDRLRNNVELKLAAIAIALAAWAYFRLGPNPVIAARFVQQLSVPITTTGLHPDQVVRYAEKQAVVGIVVPRTGGAIRPDNVRVVLDLEGRAPGVYNVPVQVIAPKLEIKSLSPASVTLSIERVENRNLPVAVHYSGDVRRNIVVKALAVEPSFATLRAPVTDLARVSGVRVDVPFPSGSSNFDAMVHPVAIDERGNEIAGIAVVPNLLRVRAKFGNAVAAH
ncbi:MAG: hypothetical protein GIW95_07750 [Candidatus Eremiobacteraeota bacterium]|nr:hypothetical protein [Candidatus Eremiobacteraeota bacterium]